MSVLSIIIPVYNVEKYLQECLESILVCKIPEYEVILVNDGSTDGSKKICDEFCDKYNFISLVSQKNQGLSAARNSGIRVAKGKYLLFLDSDDIIYGNSLERIIEVLKSCDSDILFGRAYQFEEGSTDFKLCQIEYDEYALLKPYEAFEKLDGVNEFWFAAWLVIINREFLNRYKLYFKDGIYHEDELWVPAVFVRARTAKFLNFGFYGYRVNRQGSIVATPNIKREFDKLIIVDELDRIMTTCDKSCHNLLKKRQAALVFGVLLKLQSFSTHKRFDELVCELKNKVNKLKYGKYTIFFFLCKTIGVEAVSKSIWRQFAK